MIEIIQSAPVFLIAFVFVISLVVVFHELGHYWAARWCGVHAEAFSMGFGPALYKWRDRLGTEWRIAAFPIGGYVRFLGDVDASSTPPTREQIETLRRRAEEEARAKAVAHAAAAANGGSMQTGPVEAADAKALGGVFHLQPVWKRAIIVAAGPLANFVLAIVIFTLLFSVFGSQTQPPVVGAVAPDSPAEQAGFVPGDRVLSINNRQIRAFGDIVDAVVLSSGETLRVRVERDGEVVDLTARPERTARTDPIGGEMTVGYLGVSSTGEYSVQRHNPAQAVAMGADQTWGVISGTGRYLGRVVTGRESADMLGGPVRIATYSGRLAIDSFGVEASFGQKLRLAAVSLISLAGILSVGLGLINLLPIPILDGGHLLYYAFEAASGRPLSERAQALGFRAGLVLVAGLMLFATWNDLNYIRGFFS